MPTQDTRQGGFLNGMFGGVRDRFRRERTGARNAVPGTANHDWRQTIDAITSPLLPGDWYASQNAPGDRFLPQRAWNNVREGVEGLLGPRNQPGAALPGDPSQPLPNYGQPAAPGPVGMGPLPNYQPDHTYAGPPAPLQNPQHLYGGGQGVFPATSTAGRQGTAGRFGNTIAQGQAAVNFARGIGQSSSGLGGGAGGGGGASSIGRDQMMRRWREA